jgi:hypothetical protein
LVAVDRRREDALELVALEHAVDGPPLQRDPRLGGGVDHARERLERGRGSPAADVHQRA